MTRCAALWACAGPPMRWRWRDIDVRRTTLRAGRSAFDSFSAGREVERRWSWLDHRSFGGWWLSTRNRSRAKVTP